MILCCRSLDEKTGRWFIAHRNHLQKVPEGLREKNSRLTSFPEEEEDVSQDDEDSAEEIVMDEEEHQLDEELGRGKGGVRLFFQDGREVGLLPRRSLILPGRKRR